jgi:hypothetical protein
VSAGTGPALAVKGLIAGTGVTLSSTATTLTVNATPSAIKYVMYPPNPIDPASGGFNFNVSQQLISFYGITKGWGDALIAANTLTSGSTFRVRMTGSINVYSFTSNTVGDGFMIHMTWISGGKAASAYFPVYFTTAFTTPRTFEIELIFTWWDVLNGYIPVTGFVECFGVGPSGTSAITFGSRTTAWVDLTGAVAPFDSTSINTLAFFLKGVSRGIATPTIAGVCRSCTIEQLR